MHTLSARNISGDIDKVAYHNIIARIVVVNRLTFAVNEPFNYHSSISSILSANRQSIHFVFIFVSKITARLLSWVNAISKVQNID